MSRRKPGRLGWYLILVILISLFCFVTLDVWLLPCSIAFHETGKMTAGYFLFAVIGLFFSTPTPFLAVLTMSFFKDKTGVKKLFRDIFHTEEKTKTLLITGGSCALIFIYALLFGTPNGSPWYTFIAGFLIMIPFVGIAEETGWRGVLQHELEKRMPFPFSVILTALIWFAWHFPVWIDPTSNHYGDNIIGFGITIFIWSFAAAAIYKATKSIIACALYHSFIDAVGAVYDWNELFDAFPGKVSTNVFRVIWLGSALALWFISDKCQDKLKNTFCN
ncbi:MAG: CPBP family intramembrane metalloprotease [Saccharofermentans sp.]|nr:CPBP family intramembrane metalloprotease [Saccharofermentans sp.]